MHRNRLLLVILLLQVLPAHSQDYSVYGRITNTKMEPLALVSIQIRDMQTGTLTDEKGEYRLSLETGIYELIVTMLGYKSQVIRITVNKADHQQHLILETEDSKSLSEVVLKSRSRDISEDIIRQVIRHKDAIRSAAGAYSCNIYIKATQEDSLVIRRKKRKGVDTTTNLNADLARMSVAEISLRYDHGERNQEKEERFGVSKKGNASNLFYLSTTDGQFDFYDNLINVPALSPVPFLSPVSYSGLVAYRFRMVKTEQRGRQKVYTISIKPGKLSNATVEGELTITDSSWTILHARFRFPPYHLPEYDFFEVEQDHSFVNGIAWMVTRQQFTYYSKRNKGKLSGTTLLLYKDFVLNKTLGKRYFGTELSRTQAEAYQRDSNFWKQTRPEPLSTKEVRFIRYKDSIYNATHTKIYLDSIDRETNKVTWKKLLFAGQPIYNREKERLWMVQPLFGFIQLFQFGGPRIQPNAYYARTYRSRKAVTIYGNLSYGLRNQDVNGSLHFARLYDPFRRSSYHVELGREFQYIFQGDAWINMIKRNNFYLNNSLVIGHSTELFNGLVLNVDAEMALRRSVAGYDTDKRFDSLLGFHNSPPVPFEPYNALYGKIELRYTPFQRYIREPKEKIILGSAWPTFYALWRKGMRGPFHSKVDFDYLEFGLQQSVKLGLFGTSTYTIRTGDFPDTKDLRLVDYKFQRRGDPLLFLNPNEAFQSLDSTFPVFDRFYEAHYVHEFNGAILNRIPLFKKLELREIAGGGFLFAPERNLRYAELFAGVERVFRAPFHIPAKFKLGAYVVGSAANQFRNPVQFKIGITTWDKIRNKWF